MTRTAEAQPAPTDTNARGRHRPHWIVIRWREPGDGDDIRQRERPMRQGVDPLREARSLAQAAGVPRGTAVSYGERVLATDVAATIAGRSVTIAELWLMERDGGFVWEHGVPAIGKAKP